MTLAEVRDVVEILEVVLLLAGQGAALAGRREGRSLGRELRVEIADVLFSFDKRDKGRQDFPLKESLPVHTLQDIVSYALKA